MVAAESPIAESSDDASTFRCEIAEAVGAKMMRETQRWHARIRRMPLRIPGSWCALRAAVASMLCVLGLARCGSTSVPSFQQQQPDFAAIDAMLCIVSRLSRSSFRISP